MKITQDTQFNGDRLKGQNGKEFILLNKREETVEDIVQYVADGYCINGVDDIKKYLHQQVSDPLFFKFQRGEIEEKVWLDTVAEIKALEI